MKKEEIIEKIRIACIKANPDILKLEFGVKYTGNYKEKKRESF